jgi:hypothetical protein
MYICLFILYNIAVLNREKRRKASSQVNLSFEDNNDRRRKEGHTNGKTKNRRNKKERLSFNIKYSRIDHYN